MRKSVNNLSLLKRYKSLMFSKEITQKRLRKFKKLKRSQQNQSQLSQIKLKKLSFTHKIYQADFDLDEEKNTVAELEAWKRRKLAEDNIGNKIKVDRRVSHLVNIMQPRQRKKRKNRLHRNNPKHILNMSLNNQNLSKYKVLNFNKDIVGTTIVNSLYRE